MLAAARALDVQPVGVVYVNYQDMDGLSTDCLNDRKTGFIGKIAIHPAQAEVINTAFTPSEKRSNMRKELLLYLSRIQVLV